MFHIPNGRLHLQEEGSVVALMFLKLATGVGDNAMFSIFVDLGKDGSQTTRFLVVAEAGIGNEGIGSISVRVVDDRY